jgi:hypothetical protein
MYVAAHNGASPFAKKPAISGAFFENSCVFRDLSVVQFGGLVCTAQQLALKVARKSGV